VGGNSNITSSPVPPDMHPPDHPAGEVVHVNILVWTGEAVLCPGTLSLSNREADSHFPRFPARRTASILPGLPPASPRSLVSLGARCSGVPLNVHSAGVQRFSPHTYRPPREQMFSSFFLPFFPVKVFFQSSHDIRIALANEEFGIALSTASHLKCSNQSSSGIIAIPSSAFTYSLLRTRTKT